MVANSASRLCCVIRPPLTVPTEETEAIELMELLGACEVKREEIDEVEGLEVWTGVGVVEEAEDPKRRRVEEKRREGNRRDDEN